MTLDEALVLQRGRLVRYEPTGEVGEVVLVKSRRKYNSPRDLRMVVEYVTVSYHHESPFWRRPIHHYPRDGVGRKIMHLEAV